MLQRWNETTYFDFDLTDKLCVFNVGSTEQHSDYLPLGTDSFIGEKLTEAAAEKARCAIMLMPPQRIGFSPHHRAFPGCLTLTQDVMLRYLFEICACAHDNGAKQILVVNSHGGNQSCLQTLANEVGSKLGVSTVIARYWDLIADAVANIRETGPGGMGHAGELETSLMLYLYPNLVDGSRIDKRPLAIGGEWHHPDMFARNKVYIYKPFDEYSSKGNIGQASFASREKGEKIFGLAASELARLMEYQMENGF